ncbi:hypothetical protein [Streptomyces sp. NPDC001889]
MTYTIALAAPASGPLWHYEFRASDDGVKRDMELVHTACGELLCDAEHGDSLHVLLGMAEEHAVVCPHS